MPGLKGLGWDCELGLVEGRHHDVDAYMAKHLWSQVVRIENPTGSREGRIQTLVSSIEKSQPDIVTVVNIVDAYEAVRRLRFNRKPAPRIVVALHGLQSDLMADLQAGADVIDAVIATNKLATKMAGSAIQSGERAFYAPCGVPLFDELNLSERQDGGTLRLLYSGRLEQAQKRVFDLPDLLVALRDQGVAAHLSLAGGGSDEVALRSKFEARGLQNQVGFLGILNPHDLAHEYRTHDALLITSVWETGPIVAWEAMSHGLPVLSSCYVGSGLEAALVDGVNCLLFPIGDIQAAAKAVIRLTQPGIHGQLVQGGLDLVQGRYGRLASASQWDQAFKQVIDLPLLGLPNANPTQPPSGRLDCWLGVDRGERVKRALGLSYQHQEPGGEWPHSLHPCQDEESFLECAKKLDNA